MRTEIDKSILEMVSSRMQARDGVPLKYCLGTKLNQQYAPSLQRTPHAHIIQQTHMMCSFAFSKLRVERGRRSRARVVFADEAIDWLVSQCFAYDRAYALQLCRDLLAEGAPLSLSLALAHALSLHACVPVCLRAPTRWSLPSSAAPKHTKHLLACLISALFQSPPWPCRHVVSP
jgi:hypothetical protein